MRSLGSSSDYLGSVPLRRTLSKHKSHGDVWKERILCDNAEGSKSGKCLSGRQWCGGPLR